jgi:hypothetical protein
MDRGGIETWLMHVLRQIYREQFRIDFLVHTTGPCAYDAEIQELGYRITSSARPGRRQGDRNLSRRQRSRHQRLSGACE